jgi:DNA polymerase V
MFMLVDCNNFYVSCERVFNPKLQDRPVIVLSNNDGCVIARSNQAKKLGIAMGIPYFKVAKFCQAKKVAVFSSNYMLYGDMSRRVMDILQSEIEHVEIYSIDEAFLYFSSKNIADLITQAKRLRQKILQWTGLPTSIGLGPTKTLAKVANNVAKKEIKEGVLALSESNEWRPILERLALSDIWGVGPRSMKKLLELGIKTPWALAQAPPSFIRKRFSVTLERTIYELKGTPCFQLDSIQPNKQIMVSRAFRKPITNLQEIIEAGCCYATQAFEKLRQQNFVTPRIQVFLTTHPFSLNAEFSSKIISYIFQMPTQDSRLACKATRICLEKMFKTGESYKKVGIMLTELLDITQQTEDIFTNIDGSEMAKSNALMTVMDHINHKMDKNMVFFAAQGIQRSWQGCQQWRSPCYTTRWEDLMLVY